MSKTYHIIGGGIAGLSAAKEIKLKTPDAKVIVYEAAKQCGGRCYSFYDPNLQTKIDNATHVVLGANTCTSEIISEADFEKVRFFDLEARKFCNFGVCEAALAIFNARLKDVPLAMVFKVMLKLFPWCGKRIKAYYSKNNLTEALVEPLMKFADEIRLGWKLETCQPSPALPFKGRGIEQLVFNHGVVEVATDDVVVSAIDARAYNKLFSGPSFEFNQIINIFFRTSCQITLPNGASFLGLKNALAQWVFATKDSLNVTISDAENVKLNDEELAIEVWKEICCLRRREAARLPAYRIIRHKFATIKQDRKNNQLRSIISPFSNVIVVGDWTMKNWPCSIEAAIVSAQKVIRVD